MLFYSLLITSAFTGSTARAVDLLASFGSALLSASGWVLPALLGVIIALYAGIWVQTRLGNEVEEVQRQRVELGAASEVVAGVALIWTGFCAIGAVTLGEGIGEFSGSAVLASFMLLLASRIGRFATGTLGFQEKVARREWKRARAARRTFRGVRRRPILGSALVVVLTLALPPVAITWISLGWLPEYPELGRLLVALGLMLLVLACATAVASGMLRSVGMPRFIRPVLWLVLLAPCIVLGYLAAGFLESMDGTAMTIGGIITCWSGWLLASTWPRMSRRYPALSGVSIDGALDQFALRATERAERKAHSRLQRLESGRSESKRPKPVVA
ncbi:hypothetical protein ASE14_08890 [Agromyces sp. Root81]|nr:hypothetical protein ASE14_08890 [Agromyces sp. Root81]